MMALRQRLYVIVFEHDTPAGKLFVVLLWAILLSVSPVITGYAIIAVPTGIVTSELTRADAVVSSGASLSCRDCRGVQLAADALHCRKCGARLEPHA